MTGLFEAARGNTICLDVHHGHHGGSIACDNPGRCLVGACVRMLHANADEHARFEALTNYDDDVSVAAPARGTENPQKMNRGRTRARLATLTDGQSLRNVPVCLAFRRDEKVLPALCERIGDGLHCYLSGASPETEGHLAQRIYTAVLSHDGFAKHPCLPLAETASGDNDTDEAQN